MRSHPCGLSVRLSIFKEQFEKQWRRCCRIPRKTCISSFIFTYTIETARPLDMTPHTFIRSSQALSRYVFIRVEILQTDVVKQEETETLLLKCCLGSLAIFEIIKRNSLLISDFLDLRQYKATVFCIQKSSTTKRKILVMFRLRWYENYLISTQTLCSTYKISSKMIN
jgi:hypothetical protein